MSLPADMWVVQQLLVSSVGFFLARDAVMVTVVAKFRAPP